MLKNYKKKAYNKRLKFQSYIFDKNNQLNRNKLK